MPVLVWAVIRCSSCWKPAAHTAEKQCRNCLRKIEAKHPAARLEHVPGDKVSGDWTGDCPHLTDPVTGRRMKAQVFVFLFNCLLRF